MKKTLIILSFLCTFLSFGQSYQKIPDSLLIKPYKILHERMYELLEKKDSLSGKLHARALLKKAKNNQDSLWTSYAYYYMTILLDTRHEKVLNKIDSAIFYRNCNRYKVYDCSLFYNRKALIYDDRGKPKKALNNYLIALENAKRSNDKDFENTLMHNIAVLKKELGKYQDAEILLKKTLSYEKNKMVTNRGRFDSIGYLQTLAETVSVYRLNKKVDSAEILNHRGSELSKNKEVEILFKLNEGLLDYHNKKYILAIQKIENSIPEIIEKRNTYTEEYNVIEAHLHLGLSYKGSGNKAKAVKNFIKTDSIAETQNHFFPEVITAHKELVNYYKSIDDKKNQLKYINRLLKSDSILISNYKIVGDQLFKEFDAKELMLEKEQVISLLEKENSKISTRNIIILGLLMLSIGITSFYFYRQQLYKKRFLKLVADQSTNEASKRSKSNNNELVISEEITQYLIECLQQFEDRNEYLNPNIDLISLAKSFNSNSNYLSKVINKYKGKNFAQYMNDLRVNYVIDKLKNDPVFRKYTVVALAQEVGFNNPESFSKAFYKNAGIYPSYFVKELLKQS